ncbi:arsenical pump-driving ATPase [Alkalihalophilus marmarensis]|uniref:arsenical pump-driving ATPase n=1 Tax=Alkalihalophilus marmarensis TaxID=521377 RepID=UPI002DB5D48F|nr:arsenical pump-driving ATPase [Alkalihalophilus marmarensis]MEC2071586.1 arsenical pump-driving ATPase [Alkalihalophilus marmarensis]
MTQFQSTSRRFNPVKEELTPYLFFTGKGGVGKTSTACATAVALADQGKKVLLVSTDPASNLQDVFEQEIGYHETKIDELPNVTAINLDPEEAAAAYRNKMIGPFRDKLPAPVIAQMEEQLSGACTVEIAAFDEFATILTNPERTNEYDHIIFDTAPTGHTLRLLQLPTAWSGFLDTSTHGASCLGPLSGLAEKKTLYDHTVKALSDAAKTTLILVARPEPSTLKEADRASGELKEIGLVNQWLLINGKMQSYVNEDLTSTAFYKRQEKALQSMPAKLQETKQYELPYVPYQLTGIESLRSLFNELPKSNARLVPRADVQADSLSVLINDLAKKEQGVILTMGKGGVGKTTVAAAVAAGLANKGYKVKLTTTDPAAHVSDLFSQKEDQLITVSRIDPKAEVEAYKQEVLSASSEHLDENGLAYLEEDLNSPCTEEIAVFRAFADVVEEADDAFVVIDTAPTGHTLLLLDAAHSYHKEMERSTGEVPESVKKLLPRLRNPKETDVLVVTLPEATPVFEASRLQEDLIRADITPSWWVINQSFASTNTIDPILSERAQSEIKWINEVMTTHAKQTVVIPWQAEAIKGRKQLTSL